MSESLLSWQAPEFIHVDKDARWYMWSIGITLCIALFSFFQANLLFALFVILAEAILLLFSTRRPATKIYGFTAESILLGTEGEYPLADYSAFAIIEETDRYSELVLRPVKKTKLFLKILFPRERTEDIIGLLQRSMKRFEYVESLPDVIGKRIGL